jgi:uncharacterized phage-like protein YoqJ
MDPPDFVITGMARGYDLRLAKVAIDLKIPVIAAVPFLEHVAHDDDYQFVLSRACFTHYVSRPGYASWKFQVRNQWMVDNGTRGLVCYDGSAGGTRNCIRYAEGMKKSYKNLWGDCFD